MWFQQAVALYYVSVDCVLVSQYYYFAFIRTPAVLEGMQYDDSIDDDGDSVVSYLVDSDTSSSRKAKRSQPRTHGRSRSLASTLIVVVSVMGHLVGASPISMPATISARVVTEQTTLQAVGGVLSWFSTLLYLVSRLPQLLLNFRRRSTSGLAISLFVAAFFGNLFYSLSLLLNPLGHFDYPPYGGGGVAGPDGSDHLEWWGRTLPFFIGASGVLTLDFAVGWQWLVWGERAPDGVHHRQFSDDECDGEESVGEGSVSSTQEIYGVRSKWRGWWPWNGWFGDSAADGEGKWLVRGRREYATYGALSPSSSEL